jgi:hypothetical protein
MCHELNRGDNNLTQQVDACDNLEAKVSGDGSAQSVEKDPAEKEERSAKLEE